MGSNTITVCSGFLILVLVASIIPLQDASADFEVVFFTKINDPSQFVDISGSGTPLGLVDDGQTNIFTTVGRDGFFPAGDVRVGNNGGIGVADSGSLSTNSGESTLPASDGLFEEVQVLLAFWDDIDTEGDDVYWEEVVVNGIPTLIVQWNELPHFSGTGSCVDTSVTFQVQVFESGPILAKFVYDDIIFGPGDDGCESNDNGASATIGYQLDEDNASQFSFNTASVFDGDVICITETSSIPKSCRGGGGSDASEYLSKPTFGLDHKTGVVQVEGGFTANGKIFDVTDNWHTDFERQAILVGQTNTFSAKAHADHVINIVEFMFGIPEVGFAHMAEASIEVTIDRDQNVTNVQVNQNGNLIDPGSVSATAVMAQCKTGDADKKCYFITVSGIFNEALMNDIFALKGIDFLRHFHLTYLNEGFTIFGNSINPATTLMIASNVKGSSGLMEVIQIDKRNDMWVDKSGIEYERNSFDSFIRTTPVVVVRDDPMVKVMTRLNSNFEAMKQYELDKATAIFDSSLIQKELPDSYRIESAERSDKLQDPEVQLKLFIERMRADDKMNQLMQMWYAKPNPNQLN